MRVVHLLTMAALVTLAVSALGCGGDAQDTPQTEVSQEATGTDGGMTEEQRLNKPDPNGSYGAGITLTASTELRAILAEPEMYEGKKVQVQGVVTEVCPMRGCWIEMVEPSSNETIRVKVTDGDIVFPLSAKDEAVVVEGTVERIEMTEEENRDWQEHLAEERGETFDRESVHGPSTTWRIRGEGARIGE